SPRSSSSASASPSAAPPDTPSTPLATWDPASSTRSCRSRARAARTGATPGSRSPVRSSAPPWRASSTTWPSRSHESKIDSDRSDNDVQERTMTDAHTAGPFIAAIDQGTTSSRCIIFDRDGRIVAVDQKEHEQIFPRPGWVEHDAAEIWTNVQEVVAGAIEKAGITRDDIKAIGITNQRETTVLWDRNTGEPVHNAIVWQDTRTDALCRELGRNVGQDRFRRETGLPLASYFAG